MKTFFKICGILAATFIFFIFFFVVVDSCTADPQKVIPELSKKEWVKLTTAEKSIVIEGFIGGDLSFYRDQQMGLSNIVWTAIDRSVKFRDSFEVLQDGEWIKPVDGENLTSYGKFYLADAEKGNLEFQLPFRSDNAMSMKMRNTFVLNFTYDGTSNFKISDIKFLN